MEKAPRTCEKPSATERLATIIERLRGENGCPWDREQTPRSIMIYLVEEVYELIDAIEDGDPAKVCEELGDVFFQVLFIADIYRSRGEFDLDDAANISAEKMIRRHPHVFGDKEARSVEDVKRRWHKIKLKEKEGKEPVSTMDTVPRGLPALLRAYRLTTRAARVGFDWPDVSGVMDKIKEEVAELEAAVSSADAGRIQAEFGDIFFTFVNLARFLKVHPETALTESVNKFVARFKYMEEALSKENRTVEGTDMKTLDGLWEKAKESLV
ncbi:MAG: nucleoside triphosphate pyrophosphohydrolase [Thermodesulfobacteriota bacterium]